MEQTSGLQLWQQVGQQLELHPRRPSQEARPCPLHQAGEAGDIPTDLRYPVAEAAVRPRVQFPLDVTALGHHLR